MRLLSEETRLKLKEVDQNIVQKGIDTRKDSKKGSQGTWKKISGRERKVEVQNDEQNKENLRDFGLKRTRSLGEDDDIQKVKEELGSRSK